MDRERRKPHATLPRIIGSCRSGPPGASSPEEGKRAHERVVLDNVRHGSSDRVKILVRKASRRLNAGNKLPRSEQQRQRRDAHHADAIWMGVSLCRTMWAARPCVQARRVCPTRVHVVTKLDACTPRTSKPYYLGWNWHDECSAVFFGRGRLSPSITD